MMNLLANFSWKKLKFEFSCFSLSLSLSTMCVCVCVWISITTVVTLLNTEILTDGKCHCNIRITGILVTCWEAAGCYAGVAVALHARCKQSFVVLGVRRGDGLLGSPGGRGTRWGGPDPSRSSDKLCSCFPALALHTSCRASSTSTVPFCQASLLWLFFFFKSVSLLSLFASVDAFLFPFIWFLRHTTAGRLVACLHHPKLCSFSHVFMPGICRASINPVLAHG